MPGLQPSQAPRAVAAGNVALGKAGEAMQETLAQANKYEPF